MSMSGVWGVGLNHCGQIGPDFIDEDGCAPEGHGSRMDTDESGSAATCKLWKPNTCWRLQQVPMAGAPEEAGAWEVQKMCAGGDFTVVHGRSRHGDQGAQTWICGNLSHGRFCFSSCVLDRLTPLPALSGVAVRSMACGRAHTLLSTDNGTVYSWGWNIYGQLGHGNSADLYAPTRLEYFRKAGAVARQVCCGEGFSIVVCSEGLYSFGCNHKGQLGVGYAWATSSSNLPQRVCLDAEELASGYSQKASSAARLEVACGGNHTIVLRANGSSSPSELFSWGANSDGQCGVGAGGLENLSQLLQPARVLISPTLAADGLRSVACGLSHSIILSQAGRVYSFGDGSQGQLGLGSAASMLIPTLVASLKTAVCKVICGYAHTMCLTEHADAAFAFGTNLCGELGNGDGGVRSCFEPQPVDLSNFSGLSIGALGSGPCANHTLVLTSSKLPWPMTRVLLAGAFRGDPARCMLARLPKDGTFSCGILHNIIDRVAAA